MERILNIAGNLVQESRRPRLINKFLMPEFKISSSLHPKVGTKFNSTDVFPDFNAHKPFTIFSGDEVNNNWKVNVVKLFHSSLIINLFYRVSWNLILFSHFILLKFLVRSSDAENVYSDLHKRLEHALNRRFPYSFKS